MRTRGATALAALALLLSMGMWNGFVDRMQAPAIDPGIDEALTEFITKKKDSMPDAFA